MPKLFSSQDKKFLKQIDKAECVLNRFLCENWKFIFPQYIFIASEFPLKGNVRSLGNNGRIDILAYNPTTKRFVIFELKKDYDKNITDQVADYRDYVQDNFSDIYLKSVQKYDVNLPKYDKIESDKIEIVLVAKRFSTTQIDRVRKKNQKENIVTLIRYFWFENDLVFIDYINNDPDEAKVESTNATKNGIKNMVSQDPEIYEMDRYFGLYLESKEAFLYFWNFLKMKGSVSISPQQTKIRVYFGDDTFSVIKYGGKTGRKSILQVNTNIDVSELETVIIIDDRLRSDGKKKGSLGVERYEVYLRNLNEMKAFCDFISDKIL